jgi:predicted acylesterase/phospholipase RssA
VLALSGGGPNGAFGAGFLSGWTETGARPEFLLVTGVSTGALIAPFAFLGPEHDAELAEFYTGISSSDVFEEIPLWKGLRSESVLDTAPLEELIARAIDGRLLDAVAREHRRGRRLFVGTTNMDAGRAVIWDMGAIAASGRPGALELFRKVLLASAAIPILFPPVYFDVRLGGERYDEMHSDGGALAQVFLYGLMIDLEAIRQELGVERGARPVNVYVLRNGYPRPSWKDVSPRIRSIAARTFSLSTKAMAMGDLLRIHETTRREGFGFRLIAIPSDFSFEGDEFFDPAEMRALFELGHGLGRSQDPWLKHPFELYGRSGDAGGR